MQFLLKWQAPKITLNVCLVHKVMMSHHSFGCSLVLIQHILTDCTNSATHLEIIVYALKIFTNFASLTLPVEVFHNFNRDIGHFLRCNSRTYGKISILESYILFEEDIVFKHKIPTVGITPRTPGYLLCLNKLTA